jgi:hypothetical protein
MSILAGHLRKSSIKHLKRSKSRFFSENAELGSKKYGKLNKGP